MATFEELEKITPFPVPSQWVVRQRVVRLKSKDGEDEPQERLMTELIILTPSGSSATFWDPDVTFQLARELKRLARLCQEGRRDEDPSDASGGTGG